MWRNVVGIICYVIAGYLFTLVGMGAFLDKPWIFFKLKALGVFFLPALLFLGLGLGLVCTGFQNWQWRVGLVLVSFVGLVLYLVLFMIDKIMFDPKVNNFLTYYQTHCQLDFCGAYVTGFLTMIILGTIGFFLIISSQKQAARGADLDSRFGSGGEKVEGEGWAVFEVKDPTAGSRYEFHFGLYIKTAWLLFKMYPEGFLVFSIIMMIFNGAEVILYHYQPVIALLLSAPLYLLYSGLYIVSVRLLQRQPCRFAYFFSGYQYLQPLILFGLIYGIIGCRFIIPADQVVLHIIRMLVSVAFSVLIFFSPLLIIDRKQGWWDAMKLSWRTVRRRPLPILGFYFLVVPLMFVWMIVIIPVSTCITVAAYADIFGLQAKEY